MDRQYVGIDLHRRRPVIYGMDAAGEKLGCVRIDNDPVRLAEEVARCPPDSDVVIEATERGPLSRCVPGYRTGAFNRERAVVAGEATDLARYCGGNCEVVQSRRATRDFRRWHSRRL